MQKMRSLFHLRCVRVLMVILGMVSLAAVLIGFTWSAAASPAPILKPTSPENAACLSCHSKPDINRPMPSGETLVLTVDTDYFAASAHSGLACTDCHTDITSFPHPDLKPQTLREFSLQMYTTCQQCHAEQYTRTLDSVHQRALASGNFNAAVCTDCHNPHTQTRITDPASGEILPDARLHIPTTCARCHSAIYEHYTQSMHGTALTEENNLDVPTCIDCHGVHNIGDPTTATFRLNSPLICATCHTDPAIMDKYGISAQVLNTYVADFHGTTVTLFEPKSPDQAVNKPVCYDCHGVHDIMRTDDPAHGIALKENLLTTCQKCHPDATANFPDAWLSHYVPSPEKYPVVYYVNLFYNIFIPSVIGGMVIFVLSDIYRRLIEGRKGAKHA